MNFYCTAGRGTESFLEKELKDKFQSNLQEVKVTDGKVFFKLSGDQDEAQKILQLKTAERAFFQVCHKETSKLDHRNLMTAIKTSLNDKETWREAFTVLQSTKQCHYDNSVSFASDVKAKCTSGPEGLSEPVCKRPKIDIQDDAIEDITFRVNFKCPACFRKRLNIKVVPKQIGMHIKQLMGWKVELRNPMMEICIQLNGDFLTVGLPLTREPLSKRSFIKLIGLRSTVAHIMITLLNIQSGDTVLDPMCGKATILLEAANCQTDVKYIGIDKSERQLKMAEENCQFAKSHNIQLIHGDALALPFQDSSIDKVVTDAPFGFNHTTYMPREDFYRNMLQNFSRVLTPGGRIVILTTSAMSNFIKRLTCSKQTDSSNEDIECSNSVDEMHSSCETVNENTNNENNENGKASGLAEVLSDLPDNEKEDSRKKMEEKRTRDTGEDSDDEIKIPDNDHKKIPDTKTETELITDHVCINETDNDTERTSGRESKSEINRLMFLESHYVKLGETHAYICVLERSAVQ